MESIILKLNKTFRKIVFKYSLMDKILSIYNNKPEKKIIFGLKNGSLAVLEENALSFWNTSFSEEDNLVNELENISYYRYSTSPISIIELVEINHIDKRKSAMLGSRELIRSSFWIGCGNRVLIINAK